MASTFANSTSPHCAATSPSCCRTRFSLPGTIAENIRFGNEEITEAALRQAARDVNVLDFVESLPGQFNEPVRERGNSLSTGQKQLINFARALAYNPRILILDEATSSVDTDTELRIRGALERMVEGRTSVLIAHRLSTVQRAETILVMHKGQLREMGIAPATARPARPLLEALPVAVQGPGDRRARDPRTVDRARSLVKSCACITASPRYRLDHNRGCEHPNTTAASILGSYETA